MRTTIILLIVCAVSGFGLDDFDKKILKAAGTVSISDTNDGYNPNTYWQAYYVLKETQPFGREKELADIYVQYTNMAGTNMYQLAGAGFNIPIAFMCAKGDIKWYYRQAAYYILYLRKGAKK